MKNLAIRNKGMGKLMAALLIIAMAVVGMAGANPEQLSTGHKDKVVIGPYTPTSMINGDPLTALKGFNEDVTLVGWGKQNTAPSAYGEPHAMESATELNEYYTTGDGYFNYSMESATMLDHTYDQPATKPFNGRGIPSDLPTASSVGGVKHKIS